MRTILYPGSTTTQYCIDPGLDKVTTMVPVAIKKTPVLKPFSNTIVPVAWVIKPAMDSLVDGMI